jgi:hypothetical protein
MRSHAPAWQDLRMECATTVRYLNMPVSVELCLVEDATLMSTNVQAYLAVTQLDVLILLPMHQFL